MLAAPVGGPAEFVIAKSPRVKRGLFAGRDFAISPNTAGGKGRTPKKRRPILVSVFQKGKLNCVRRAVNKNTTNFRIPEIRLFGKSSALGE